MCTEQSRGKSRGLEAQSPNDKRVDHGKLKLVADNSTELVHHFSRQ